MTDFNLVVVEGRLVRDADLKYSKDGKPFTTFSIASNYWNGKEEAANFFDVVAFEELKLSKGDKIRVQGVLRQDTWEKEGQKMSKIKIIAGKVDKLFHKKQEQKADGSQGYKQENAESTKNEKGSSPEEYDWPPVPKSRMSKFRQTMSRNQEQEFKDDIPF